MHFLGFNIGNIVDELASEFITRLASNLSVGDILFLGVYLIKYPFIVLLAYNDSEGVNAAFDLNLLVRINKELGGTFEIDKFAHHPVYSEIKGIARSFLISLEDQTVLISALEKNLPLKNQ